MTIPSTVPQTAAGHIDYLSSQVNLADKMWTHYAWAVSKAYASAYDQQKTTLGKVKSALERQKKEDYDRMSLALSILTVGVAGGVAGAVGRFMYDSKNAQDTVKNIVQRVMQQPTTGKSVVDLLSPDKTVVDNFAPGGTTPDQYTAKLFEGITYNIAFLTELLDQLKWNPNLSGVPVGGTIMPVKANGELSLAEAKAVTEAIIDSSFMQEMPPLEVTSDLLMPKALLALWIGWAMARDAQYWKVPLTNLERNPGNGPVRGDDLTRTSPPGFHEQFYWEPVRHELTTLGVPTPNVTAKIFMIDGGWGGSQGLKEFPGLFMWGFMQWATSPMALDCLFDKTLPRNAKGFEQVKQKLANRMLTDKGWVEVTPAPKSP